MEIIVQEQLVDEVITEAIKIYIYIYIYRDYPHLSYYEAIDQAKTILGFKGE